MRPAPTILAAVLVALCPAAVRAQASSGHAGAPAAHPAPPPAVHPAPPPAVHPAPPPVAPPAPLPTVALPPPSVPLPYVAAPATAAPPGLDLSVHGITTHPAPPPGPRTPGSQLAVHPAPPPNRPGEGHPAPPPSPTHTPIPPPVVVPPVAPFWWGWGWGWGYYPFYPAPPPPDVSDLRSGGQALGAEGPGASATLRATVATDTRGSMAGLAFAADGRSFGLEASIDGVDPVRAQGTPESGTHLLWSTMYGTWSVVSERSLRMRVEVGGSMLSMGDTGGASPPPYSGSTLLGPSFGVSGHLGLLGPVGLEGHMRVTPSPVPVNDGRIALAIRGGTLAMGLGYRWLGIQGDGQSAPDVRFAGPELQIAARF